MSLAIGLFMIGAGCAALWSLIESFRLLLTVLAAHDAERRRFKRVEAFHRQLLADRQRLANATPYTGPTYTRHGREIEGN